MNVHEYQAKDVLKKYGVPVPDFRIVRSVVEAEQAIEEMKLDQGVVKVMVHAGGRGKAGGVKLGKSKQELMEHCRNLIGMKIVNNQTGPDGVISHSVMVTELTDIAKEYYVGAVIDRERAEAVLICSPEGGMDIEEVAAKTPERIRTVSIGLNGEIKGFQLMGIAKFMGWSGKTAKQGMQICKALAKAFMDCDGSLLEINPLVETGGGDILAVDAKLSVDENALWRQKELAACYDPTQQSPFEVEANKHDLAYIALDGNIGCMVNGAGLAMATMDIIHHYGGEPANFLDVGGGANEEKISEGFKILLSDPRVKGILVNIFGGIMDCNVLAKGVVKAAAAQKMSVPLVVRMEGTNVEAGKQTLKESGLALIAADQLADAAEKVVASISG